MPDIFDIDYDQMSVDILPPDKRTSENVSILGAALSSLQRSRDLVIGDFKKGSTVAAYSPGAYNIYDLVKFNKGIYESRIANNADTPDIAASWLLIQPNFIGVDERQKYNAQNIVLEWALNKEFDGVFRQPVTGMLSDIYLVRIAPVLSGFRLGQDETAPGCSSIGQDIASDSIGGNYPFVQVNCFDIKIKNSLYALTNDAAIRNFVNKYIPKSLNYTITPY